MVAEGFSLRIGLQCNADLETQPEGCGYQKITARRGYLSRAKSRMRRSSYYEICEKIFSERGELGSYKL